MLISPYNQQPLEELRNVLLSDPCITHEDLISMCIILCDRLAQTAAELDKMKERLGRPIVMSSTYKSTSP